MARTVIILGHKCFMTEDREDETGGVWPVLVGGLLCLLAAPFLGILWAWSGNQTRRW